MEWTEPLRSNPGQAEPIAQYFFKISTTAGTTFCFHPNWDYIQPNRPKSGHVETLVKSYISLVLTYLHMHSGHWQPIPFLFVLTYAQWA